MESAILFLKEQRNELLEFANRFTDHQLNEKTEQGKWSAMQVLEHLYLIERSITTTIEKLLERGDRISIPIKPIHLTVDRSTKVEAPSYVVPDGYDQTFNEISRKLDASRNELLQIIQPREKHELQNKGFPHPVFGLMSLDQWVEFIGHHEKRHLLQMKELLISKQTAGE